MGWFLRIFKTKSARPRRSAQRTVKTTGTEEVQLTETEHTQVFSLGRPVLKEAESLPRIRAELVIKTGESKGMKLRLGKSIANLGRRETNEVFLDDPNISRVHAQIELLQDEYILTDLGSLNGTYVNGKRIRRVRLNSGDQIKLGKTELDFQIM